jgi:hypothetical protein
MKKWAIRIMVVLFLTILALNTTVNVIQNHIINKMVTENMVAREYQNLVAIEVLILREKVARMEKEDQRLQSHIKWFVMRRSGTDELRKMEAAVAKMEADLDR